MSYPLLNTSVDINTQIDQEVGNFQDLFTLIIDGITYFVNTDTCIYTASSLAWIRSPKICVTNNSGALVTFRIAISTSIVQTSDYILYDRPLAVKESVIIEIPVLKETEKIFIRSSSTDVTFNLSGILVNSPRKYAYYKLDIDGISNLVNTDYKVFTSILKGKVSFIVCNRNNATNINFRVAMFSGSGSPVAKDYKYYGMLLPLETISYDVDHFISDLSSLSFQSDISNVNIIAFVRSL